MYVLTNGEGKVLRYPYHPGLLRIAHPNVSFPVNMSDAQLAEWNVYPVEPTPVPGFNELTHRLVEDKPVKAGDKWKQVWVVEMLSSAEATAALDAAMESLRWERDTRLRDSDWTQIADAPFTAEQKLAWVAYRQALRDLPKNTVDPLNPVWPSTPGSRR